MSVSAQSIEQNVVHESYGYDNWGSSFRATKSGEIYRIDVYASGLALVNSNLLIYKGGKGSGSYQIRGVPVYEQSIDVDSYTGWTSIFLTTPQPIIEDSIYTFIVETTAGVWGIDSINAYPDGGLIIGYGHDYSFQTDIAFKIWEGPITGPPTIISQPQTKTICEDLPAQFQFKAGSTTEMTFAWQTYIDGLWTNIADDENYQGTQTSVLTINSVKPSLSRWYRGLAINTDGTSYSDSAGLIYKAATFVEKSISDKVFCRGENLDVPLSISGFNLSYQWMNDQGNLPDQIKDTLRLLNLQPDQTGSYYAVVYGDCGVDSTAIFNVLVKDSTHIVSFPTEANICIGADDSIKVLAGGYNLNYQWYKNNTLLSEETFQSLSFVDAQKTDEAYYNVLLSGDCGTILSDSVLLSIHEVLTIQQDPVHLEVRKGEPAGFKVKAAGSQISYRWRKDGVYLNDLLNISGAYTDSLSLSITDFSDVGSYDCEMNSFCNSHLSGSALLSINTTGITDNKRPTFSIFPNPVENTLTVTGSKEITSIEIFDIKGLKIIHKNDRNMDHRIPVDFLPQGIYIVKIQTLNSTDFITMIKW